MDEIQHWTINQNLFCKHWCWDSRLSLVSNIHLAFSLQSLFCAKKNALKFSWKYDEDSVKTKSKQKYWLVARSNIMSVSCPGNKPTGGTPGSIPLPQLGKEALPILYSYINFGRYPLHLSALLYNAFLHRARTVDFVPHLLQCSRVRRWPLHSRCRPGKLLQWPMTLSTCI